MPEKFILDVPNISSVAASRTVILELPVDRRYNKVIIHHGYSSGTNTIAAAATNISEIRVKQGSIVRRKFSGTQLRDHNLKYGTQYDCDGLPNTAPGVSFPIHFGEPWMADEVDQDALMWPTYGWDSLNIEVDLGAASTPTLIASMEFDYFRPKTAWITELLAQQCTAGGVKFDVPAFERKGFLRYLQIYPDSGGSNAISKATLDIAGVVRHNLTTAQNKSALLQAGLAPAASGRTANIYDIFQDKDGLLGAAPFLEGKAFALTIEAASAMSGNTSYLVGRMVDSNKQ